jgi:hypothetical protein
MSGIRTHNVSGNSHWLLSFPYVRMEYTRHILIITCIGVKECISSSLSFLSVSVKFAQFSEAYKYNGDQADETFIFVFVTFISCKCQERLR